MSMARKWWNVMGLAFMFCASARAAELKVDTDHGVRILQTAQLLARHDAQNTEIPADIAYKRAMRFRAIPLLNLLGALSPDDHLQFTAADGFSAEIPASLLLDKRGSQAWLAVENPAKPWPTLAVGKPSAGPFYVVWTHPEAGHVGQEQWPYQVVAIRRLPDVGRRFPALLPDPSLPADSPVRRGFTVFTHICLACHTLNGSGEAKLGPDLNIPHNPTEYLRADLLRAYVRDPQSLRRWPQARMPGFSPEQLSDIELDDLLAYLRHMAGRKSLAPGD